MTQNWPKFGFQPSIWPLKSQNLTKPRSNMKSLSLFLTTLRLKSHDFLWFIIQASALSINFDPLLCLKEVWLMWRKIISDQNWFSPHEAYLLQTQKWIEIHISPNKVHGYGQSFIVSVQSWIAIKSADFFKTMKSNPTGRSISSIRRVPIEILPGKRHIT